NFVVAGIGRFLAVRHRDDAAFVLIAEKLSAPGDLVPEKREQSLSPLLHGVAPELSAQRVGVLHVAVFLGHQIHFRSVEQLLPAKPVADDEENVLGFEGGGVRVCDESETAKRDQRDDKPQSGPGGAAYSEGHFFIDVIHSFSMSLLMELKVSFALVATKISLLTELCRTIGLIGFVFMVHQDTRPPVFHCIKTASRISHHFCRTTGSR